MNKLYILSVAFFILLSCNAYKNAERKLNRGDYAAAFETSLKVFKKNSSQKKKEKQLILLQTAYLKANEEDLKKLEYSQRQLDYKQSYFALKDLYQRNNDIKPLLPLYNSGRELKFPVKDYSSELAIAKENYLNQYYTQAMDLLSTKDKYEARQAYEYFTEVKGVDKYYRDVVNMQQSAYNQGADIVFVTTENRTGVPFPLDFKDNLLYSLHSSVRNFWTQVTINPSDPRDYMVNVVLRQAFVGNDIVTTNTYNYEKEFKDGWEFMKDGRGNIIKDSLGNGIRVDRYVRASARVTEYIRHKEAMLSADIQIYNAYTGAITHSYPAASDFVFESAFATVEGDERALDFEIRNIVNTPPVPFPNNYDMITQCGMRLKEKLIDVLNSFN